MVVPAFLSAMAVFENSKNRSLDMTYEWLMPAVPFLHGLWFLAYLACFHIKQLEGDSYVPYAWRSVLYLDAFGWARHSNPVAGTRRGGGVGTPSSGRSRSQLGQTTGQPAMEALCPSVPCRPEDIAPQQSNNREGINVSFSPSSFAATSDVKEEDGDDIFGTKVGELPWLMYKWTTVFLACLWFWAGANDLFALATGDRSAEAFKRSQYFNASKLNLLQAPPFERLQGTKIETKWNFPLLRPRGLDCDPFGGAFLASGLDLSGRSTLLTSAVSSNAVSFTSLAACLDTEDTVEDFTWHCKSNAGCTALVLPRKSAQLVNCPLDSSAQQETKDSSKKPLLGAGRVKPAAIVSSVLHRAWLDDRGASSLEESPFEGAGSDIHNHPEEISAMRKIFCPPDLNTQVECVVVGTTARRVVLLANLGLDPLSEKSAWVPRQILNHDVGEVPGPGAFALFGKRYLGVLLRNSSIVKLIDLQSADLDGHDLHLPKEQRWSAICGGGGHLFGMEAGTNPSLWRFEGSQLAAFMPTEPRRSSNEPSDTAVAVDPDAQWSFSQDASAGLAPVGSRKQVPLLNNGEIAGQS